MIERARLKSVLADEVRKDRAEFVGTEFLDRVAHELRGPAGVTLGALDEIELALGDAAEQSRPFLAMARRGAFKVLRTADRLTRTAQLEAGVQFQLATTDLRQLVHQSGVDALRLDERANVKLEILLPEAPCRVSLDARWVEAAITELICHAMHRARRHVSVQLGADNVLVITNDGTNSPANLPSQRFERGVDRKDAGLALPLARAVASAHGGTFSIESNPDGMSVRISFGEAR